MQGPPILLRIEISWRLVYGYPEVPYQITTVKNHLKVQLLPELNESAWNDLETLGDSLLQELKDQKNPSVIIDLSKLSYISSSLVAVVIQV